MIAAAMPCTGGPLIHQRDYCPDETRHGPVPDVEFDFESAQQPDINSASTPLSRPMWRAMS
jgi:hypothetical protein